MKPGKRLGRWGTICGGLLAALFLAGIAVTQIAGLIPGAGVRYVGLGAGVVALVAVVWGLGIDNRTAFEAFRPTSSGGAVGVLCHFDPAAGYWTALASCVLTLGAGLAVLRTGGPAWR